MADSGREWGWGAGRSLNPSEHLLLAQLSSWHDTCHLISSIYCFSKLFAIFSLHPDEKTEVDIQTVNGRSRSQIFSTPTLKQAPSGWWTVVPAPQCGIPEAGWQHPHRPCQWEEGCNWSWILKDKEKCSRQQRKQKIPKQRQCEKSTEKKVSEEWHFRWQSGNQRAGLGTQDEADRWHHPALLAPNATTLAQDPGCPQFR